AFDARLKQWRAVKVLAANFIDDEHVRARFEHEAEAMARLSHRNLLRVVDIDIDGGTPFIVMELARGGAITDWLKRHGVMPARQAIQVVMQACDGLAHAHGLGVVHRDVKPHNLLISDDGRILLTDFGIAQLAESISMTQTGSVMGTFAYMAPEQRNDAKSVDGRADVYALGATLFTILTLRTSAELFFAEARDEILEPVDEPLRDVILEACRYDRDERIGSVLALKAKLAEVMERLPDVPCPPLTDAILPLPERPPLLLDEGSGVEDLQKSLATRDADAPTYVPRGRLDQLLEEQSTTLYSDTGIEEAGGAAWVMQTPDLTRSPARRGIEDLSEEDVPSYVDVSTMDRQPRPPSPQVIGAPAPLPQRQPARSIAPPPRRPVQPAMLQTEPEATADEGVLSGLGSTANVAAVAAAMVVFVVGLVLGYGIVDKTVASMSEVRAGAYLVRTSKEQHSLIEELVAVGADREVLEARWFAFSDAPPVDQARLASEFVDAVVMQGQGAELRGMAETQAQLLVTARDEWVAADVALQSARSSWVARLTGDLGVQTRR
ncbi:MAG: serine/threonine protein kinase, partial [Myxococcales bacterium]|nr:serine/threonine protein kinase [Myxococcales bacterium]